ncbi:MAG TPA: prepilin-type N-terminal cleavage/methylation domain-containing protein [Phycisphaerales bacterium]|nr:prepilin-type N-terminal cleavage/methylation domain-containing protein [Phycisphaerales bacterium]
MKSAHRHPRAFSLVELLVVIAIIGIVIAILIPALRGARIQARKVSTQSTLRDLSNACNQFTNDHHRNPGHFSPAQMGAGGNIGANGGFTGMQNLLLDISGGLTKAGAQPGTIFDVGPGGSTTQMVDITKIGAAGAGKGYFTPDKSLLVADAGLVGAANNKLMPQVVDAFGNPILAWVADERPAATFAAESSGTIAKFYWASNAGVLQSTAIGRDQRDHNNGGSMLGGGYSAADRVTTMAALLGNPVFPKANLTPQAPERARGEIVFQSPGADGFFMGRFDRGTKTSGTPSASPTMIMYNGAGVDVLTNFDDITQAAGL